MVNKYMLNVYSQEQIDFIHKKLTVAVKSDYGISKIFKLYDQNYNLPLVWATENIKNYPIKLFLTTKINISSNIVLRDLQKSCMEKIQVEMDKKTFGGGIINLKTGGGKTLISLFTIAKYKYKTVIVVNTVELMQQWTEAIKKFLNCQSVGYIRGKQADLDCDIVIATIQTLCKRNYDLSKFTLCFIDECHHLSAEVFSNALSRIRVKYVFGLSATVERLDGLEYVFKYHIGGVIFSDKQSGVSKQATEIKRVDYTGPSSKELFLYNGKPKISTMISNIAEDPNRNKILIDLIKDLPGDRKVLVLSDRIIQLKYIYSILGPEISGLFIGKTDADTKNITRKKKIMLATYAIASEGFNHPELNTLVFATPRSNITQSIGRIYRKQHENPPLIIDIVDNFSIFPYQYKKRQKIYSTEISKKTPVEIECLFD